MKKAACGYLFCCCFVKAFRGCTRRQNWFYVLLQSVSLETAEKSCSCFNLENVSPLFFPAFFKNTESVPFICEMFVLWLGLNWNKLRKASKLPPFNSIYLLNVGSGKRNRFRVLLVDPSSTEHPTPRWKPSKQPGWYLTEVVECFRTDWLAFHVFFLKLFSPVSEMKV